MDTVKEDLLTNKDYSVSLARMIAMLMIITCHIMQWLGSELAWWFNVGVQIFLCISGFLYGQKRTGNIKNFILRRFRKILIPYYIVIVPVIIIYFIFAGKDISFTKAIKVLIMCSTLRGGGHLWFVPTILLCYVCTPILESFYKECTTKTNLILTSVIGIVAAVLFTLGFAAFYNPAWLGCYAI